MNLLREFWSNLLGIMGGVSKADLNVVLGSRGQSLGDFADRAMSQGQQMESSGQRSVSAANKAVHDAWAQLQRKLSAAGRRKASGLERAATGRRLQQAANRLSVKTPPKASA